MKQKQNEHQLRAVWPQPSEENIYTEVEQTIAEHKKVMQQWQEVFEMERTGARLPEKDIYTEVEETIAEHQKVMAKWETILSNEGSKYYVMLQQQAA